MGDGSVWNETVRPASRTPSTRPPCRGRSSARRRDLHLRALLVEAAPRRRRSDQPRAAVHRPHDPRRVLLPEPSRLRGRRRRRLLGRRRLRRLLAPHGPRLHRQRHARGLGGHDGRRDPRLCAPLRGRRHAVLEAEAALADQRRQRPQRPQPRDPPVTNYVMASGVRPTPMGSQAHFLAESRGFVSVQEYTRLAGADPTEAADITAHVPHLIPKGASQIIPLPDLDALVVLTKNAATTAQKHKAFVYQFFWDGDKKLQSAWRPWDFGDGTPITARLRERRPDDRDGAPDGSILEKMDLSPRRSARTRPPHLPRPPGLRDGRLQRRHEPDDVQPRLRPGPRRRSRSSAARGRCAPRVVIDPVGYVSPGRRSRSPATSTRPRRPSATSTRPRSSPRQFPLDWQNRPLTTGRLQLHTFTVNLTDTAYLRAEVYPYGPGGAGPRARPQVHHRSSPRGSSGAPGRGPRPARYATARSPSRWPAGPRTRIELINDTAFDSTITSAEWEGLFFSRAL
jgi:hypothetical protein